MQGPFFPISNLLKNLNAIPVWGCSLLCRWLHSGVWRKSEEGRTSGSVVKSTYWFSRKRESIGSLVTSIHTRQFTTLYNSSSKGSDTPPLLAPKGTSTYVTDSHTDTHSFTWTKNKCLKFFEVVISLKHFLLSLSSLQILPYTHSHSSNLRPPLHPCYCMCMCI